MIKMNRRDVFALAASAALAGTFGLPAFAQDAATPAPTAEAPPVPDMVLGSPDAKVTLTEYASYTCPHCANSACSRISCEVT